MTHTMDPSVLTLRGVLDYNGPQMGDRVLTNGGSYWLWAVTGLFLLSFLAVALLSLRPFHNEKIFHYLFAIALIVGTVSYYAQASGLAYAVVGQVNQTGRGLTRQIHWPKYVNWVVSFPIVVIALGLVSGVSWATIAFNVALTWVWIISFLVAAFTQTNYKWGFFVLGLLAFLYLVVNAFVLDGRRTASRFGATGRHHTMLGGYVAFLWFMYVLAWGLSDGGNVLGVTGAFIWYGILDLLLIPVLAFAFLFLSRRWDYGAMNLHFTQYGRVARGGDFPEKGVGAGHGIGHGAGPGVGAGTGAGVGPGISGVAPTTGGMTAGYGAGSAPGTTAGNTTGGYGVDGHGVGPTPGGTAAPVGNTAPGQQQYV